MTNSLKGEDEGAKKIKSFQYLDTEKMYSISSQIFSGLTEYILDSKHQSNEERTSQKGRELFSGQILADIIQESTNTTEKKFLHDYSYTLFEDSLIQSNRVLEVHESDINELVPEIGTRSFIKVTGKILFNDVRRVTKMVKNFNDFGYAIWYISQGKDLVSNYKEAKSNANKIVDRNKKAALNARIDSIVHFKDLIKEAGLSLDPDYLQQMAYVLDYGYEDQFEIQMPFSTEFGRNLFSAQLNRAMLRESEDLLIKKYSIQTEREFTIFGILTQTDSAKRLVVDNESDPSDISLKEALMNVISSISGVETHFTGKLDHEYVIDPIAVYLEI